MPTFLGFEACVPMHLHYTSVAGNIKPFRFSVYHVLATQPFILFAIPLTEYFGGYANPF
nr:hypothetical protein BSM_18800 [uncultured archaeon]